MKPYIFGHRGASGYEIENTISAYKKAVDMGAGIEADVQLTQDNKLICFHDPFFVIGSDYYVVRKLTLNEIREKNFEDNRKVPLVKEVFDNFKENSTYLRYSFDILEKNAGLALLTIIRNNLLLQNIEITDRRLYVLSFLRKHSKKANLVYTIAEHINKISDKTLNLKRLRKLDIKVINIRCKRNVEDLFKEIIDNGFKCYIWDVNTKLNMRKVINMNYSGEIVSAIYTDYPDKLNQLMEDHFK
ncbi:MAG: glycerophosphodiester phosphodiesterase [Promethearchaeota archaeon]